MQLPPQAYTKETLIQAYNWLRTQPVHVQEMAKSPDALVSLFTKSQIHGENYLSRTNLQGFKSDLKNLAHIMGDLDSSSSEQQNTKPPTPPQKNPAGSTTPSSQPPPSGAMTTTVPSHSSPFPSAHNKNAIGSNTHSNSANTAATNANANINSGYSNRSSSSNHINNNNPMMPMVTETQLQPSASNYPLFNTLMNTQQALEPQDLRSLIDSRSWGMLQEVKNHLNLSSETEALRLLISLGYQKIRPQF